MKCPGCSTTLVANDSAETSGGYIQRCPACRGMWLGRDVLEGGHAGIWANLEDMGVDTIESLGDYLCPRCAVTLTAVCPHDHPELRIDRCPGCHGVWLDNGELAKLHRVLAEYEYTHATPTTQPEHWSTMKWVMYRMYENWKGTYQD